jgi:hypothetical protein
MAVIGPGFVRAEPYDDHGDRDHRRPVYQRHAFDWNDKHGREPRQDRFFGPRFATPQISAGWFQRPYPYHLDYYRMRYGGSYAPYFGNLYGPPQVVTAPPYYGPYYGGYEYGNPQAYGSNGAVYAAPEQAAPAGQPAVPPNGESLPAPAP